MDAHAGAGARGHPSGWTDPHPSSSSGRHYSPACPARRYDLELGPLPLPSLPFHFPTSILQQAPPRTSRSDFSTTHPGHPSFFLPFRSVCGAASPPPSTRVSASLRVNLDSHRSGLLALPAADPEEEPGGKSAPPPAMDAGGGVQAKGVNPDCPNAANPFHRCAEYCPVPAPRAAPKPSPPRSRPAQNGTRNGDGGKRVVPATDGSEEERAVAKSPPPPPPPGPGYAAQNGTAHRDEEECEITVADDSDEAGESVEESPEVGGARRSARPPAKHEVAGGERQWQGVNPDCPNAGNPFHRCAEYCPVPAPRAAAKHPAAARRDDVSTHSDPGRLQPRPRRRDKGGGSGGLPLYVFLREGSDGDGKKVDPRCPNAPNPFHVCTDHCLAKMAEAGRSSEGAKSPLSLFSRHSRRSSSSSEEGSVKSAGSRKVDPKCPNAGNPFHECGEHCAAKMQQVEQHKGTKMQSPRRKGGKDVTVIPNWKVDPRCPNASNPFHMCAQYCFDHLNEATQTSATKSDKKKGKAITKEVGREINPDCANASNPYHKCGENCKRKGR